MKISKFIKRGLLVVASVMLVMVALMFFYVSDLRTTDAATPNNPEKARALLEEMGKAHGISSWGGITSYQVIFGDEFYGTIGTNSTPFAEPKTQLAISHDIPRSSGQLEILTGEEKGTIWGYDNGDTYVLDNAGNKVPTDSKDIKFWIPTYWYFAEFAFRIQEATAVEYVGTGTIKGHEVEGVLASWNTVKPQEDIDQYIVWIDSSTKRIVKVEYTIREMFPFLTGAAYFEEYKTFGDILLPTKFPVESNLVGDGLLHQMSILDFKDTSKEKK